MMETEGSNGSSSSSSSGIRGSGRGGGGERGRRGTAATPEEDEDGEGGASFPVSCTITMFDNVMVAGSPLAATAGNNPAALARFFASLHFVRHGPVGNVTPANEEADEALAFDDDVDGESGSKGPRPQILSTWTKSMTRQEAGLATGEDEVTTAADRSKDTKQPLVHTFGMEYVLAGSALDATTGNPIDASQADAAAAASPHTSDTSGGVVVPTHHYSTTFIFDSGSGRMWDVTFRCPDGWWEEVWEDTQDAGSTATTSSSSSSAGVSSRRRGRGGASASAARAALRSMAESFGGRDSAVPATLLTHANGSHMWSGQKWMNSVTICNMEADVV